MKKRMIAVMLILLLLLPSASAVPNVTMITCPSEKPDFILVNDTEVQCVKPCLAGRNTDNTCKPIQLEAKKDDLSTKLDKYGAHLFPENPPLGIAFILGLLFLFVIAIVKTLKKNRGG